MVDFCKCHYCGQPTSWPMLFTWTRQRIFNYIWNNPGCSTKDIAKDFYGNPDETASIEQHIYSIRRGLKGTGYEIINLSPYRGMHASYIIRETTKPKETANVDVQSPNSLP